MKDPIKKKMQVARFLLNLIIFLFIFPSFVLLPIKIQGKTQDDLRNKYDHIITAVARRHGVNPDLIHSIISVESNYNHKAISSKGAVGLMQLMPETAEEYGVNNLFDPEENIEGGVKYLKDLNKLYNEQLKLVLAAYNAGQEAIKKFGGIPPYPETKNYINKILSSYNRQTVSTKSKIYQFYDSQGRLVLTNDPHYYMLNRGR